MLAILLPLLPFLPLGLVGASASAATCGEDLQARLSAAEPAQGRIVLLEVRGATEGLRARWGEQALHFWREGPGSPLRALVGIDLERATGPSSLLVTAEGASPCAVDFVVTKGDYPLERLQLRRGLVDLSPKDLTRATREAERLRRIYAQVTPERLWTGGFRLPLEGTEPSDNFGRLRILNGKLRAPHAGVDFQAPPGTPVGAPQRGRVVLASALFFSGRTVVLDHGLGVFSFYGHLSALDVKEGEMVDAGAPLGRVGATGRATGPHLHWGLRLNGARVDPLDLVALLRTP